MIERERPERRPFISRRILMLTAIGVAAVLFAVVVVVLLGTRSLIQVPEVTGLDEDVAIVRLAQAGLDYTVTERPFDPASEGIVLTQDPEPGEKIQDDQPVELVVSSGTEEFSMPDVTGLSVRVAQAQLSQRGLVVRVDTMASEAPVDTVIMSNPAPEAIVRTSDIVRLTVSAEGTATTALLPFSLSGDTFVLDASAVPVGVIDAPLEVARRLQSLLEASGATVTMTRDAASLDTSPQGRAAGLAGPTATAVIGIDAPETGAGGYSIATLSEQVAPSTYVESQALADEMVAAFTAAGSPVARSTKTADPVLTAAGSVGLRFRLGSFSIPEDASLFRDPAWADGVARTMYRAIGQRYEGR